MAVPKLHSCEGCPRDLECWDAAEKHMSAGGHRRCEICGALFHSHEDVESHYAKKDSLVVPLRDVPRRLKVRRRRRIPHGEDGPLGSPFLCEYDQCGQRFYTKQQAGIHLDDEVHWRVHWWGECSEGFPNEYQLMRVCFLGLSAGQMPDGWEVDWS